MRTYRDTDWDTDRDFARILSIETAIRRACAGTEFSDGKGGWREVDATTWACLAHHYSFMAFVAAEWAIDWAKNWGYPSPPPWLVRNVLSAAAGGGTEQPCT